MKGWSQAEISTLGLRIAIRKIHPSPPQLCIYDNFHGQENSVVKVYNSPYGASLLMADEVAKFRVPIKQLRLMLLYFESAFLQLACKGRYFF